MTHTKRVRKYQCFFLSLLLTLMGTGCGLTRQHTAFEAQYFDLFDTVTSFTIYTDTRDSFQEYSGKLYQKLKQYHRWYTIYDAYEGVNNIKTINEQAGIQPVTVDKEIIGLLKFGVEMYKETDGYVNIAFGSVLRVWHKYREAGLKDPEKAALPDSEELDRAKKHTDISKLRIDEKASTVYLEDPEMSLDVGAIAKGYSTERLAEFAQELGIDSALLNVGGNVRVIGQKPDGNHFSVGVQNPNPDSEPAYVYKLSLADETMVTSGDYQRYYEVAGIRYHHIIHKDTLYPSSYYRSVTIIARDSGLADALSTAVFNMPAPDGKKFVEKIKGAEAVFVFSDGSITVTDGLSGESKMAEGNKRPRGR